MSSERQKDQVQETRVGRASVRRQLDVLKRIEVVERDRQVGRWVGGWIGG